MTHMHSAGLVHLDISLENTMMTPEGRVVLIDFGTTRPLPHYEPAPHFAAGFVGKMQYAAPEVSRTRVLTYR